MWTVPTQTTQDAARDRMGAKALYTLRELTGREQIKPGEEVPFTFNLVAPQNTGLYAFHWEMRTDKGKPFGTTRWLQIGVRALIPITPIITTGRTAFGMNINPNEEYVADIERHARPGLGALCLLGFARRQQPGGSVP